MRKEVDRLIVHQFDPARPSPGGIDTCLRGICGYVPSGVTLAIVGVDTGSGGPERRLGKWETHRFGSNTIRFMPVVRLDPADQNRRVPHSIRLIAGLLRYRTRMPKSRYIQAHRMDTALATRLLFRRPLAYMIHTQENGLTGETSDSFWKSAGKIHQRLEKFVVTVAQRVHVFNEAYSKVVQLWNPVAKFSPTWFDPALIRADTPGRALNRIVWVGRLEVPKDPVLAIQAFRQLVDQDDTQPWTLEILGSGTLQRNLEADNAAASSGDRVLIRGRVAPEDVAKTMAGASVFLMTSHPGYEGYPRVLVEAMASGLLPVVTDGSDTGSLVRDGITGFVTGRGAQEIATRITEVIALDRDDSNCARNAPARNGSWCTR